MNRPTWLASFTALDDDTGSLVPILLLDAFRLDRSGSSDLRFAVIDRSKTYIFTLRILALRIFVCLSVPDLG